MVHTLILTLAGLISSALWLTVLVASGYSSAALGVGLLGMLVLLSDRPRTLQ